MLSFCTIDFSWSYSPSQLQKKKQNYTRNYFYFNVVCNYLLFYFWVLFVVLYSIPFYWLTVEIGWSFVYTSDGTWIWFYEKTKKKTTEKENRILVWIKTKVERYCVSERYPVSFGVCEVNKVKRIFSTAVSNRTNQKLSIYRRLFLVNIKLCSWLKRHGQDIFTNSPFFYDENKKNV